MNEAPAVIDSQATKLEKSMDKDIALSHQVQQQQQQLQAMANKLNAMELSARRKATPPTFLGPVEPFVKSFDDHLLEADMTLPQHLNEVQISLQNTSINDVSKPSMEGMAKSIEGMKEVAAAKVTHAPQIEELEKSFSDNKDEYVKMVKSILGESAAPGAAGSWYHFLEENLSRLVLAVMLQNEDCTALQSIPTAITTSIVPEVARLKSSGVGYGKHTMGFKEGDTAVFGGSQLMDRVSHILVQRGIRAAVTQMLLANRAKLVKGDPLAVERELRILEWNLGKNHQLIWGDSLINKDGTTVLETEGLMNLMLDATNGKPANVYDWNGRAFDSNNVALDMFRMAAETLVVGGHIQGGRISGKYNVLMDFGVANKISTIVDSQQRILIDNAQKEAQAWGQSFSGFVTDLGTFKFKRSKTLHLTAGDTWTPDDDVSKHAIAWPAISPQAIPTAIGANPKAVPAGSYTYRVSVVNDHGESKVSSSFLTTSDGSAAHAVAADEVVALSIPYNSAFAGGTVNGYVVSPARYFLVYRGKVGETADANLKCIAKVPINGTSTTTWVDCNLKMPGCTDMFFVPNNPLDLAHTSLIPPMELPIFDPAKATTKQWMIFDIAALCLWVASRVFIIRNVPSFTPTHQG